MSHPDQEPVPLWQLTERQLWQRYDTANDRITWRQILRDGQAAGRTDDVQVAERVLDHLPDVTAVDGLAAGAVLIQRLTGYRWILMREARADGATWDEIGLPLDMTGDQARDWYREQIAFQERYVPEFHDTARARAALEDDAQDHDENWHDHGRIEHDDGDTYGA